MSAAEAASSSQIPFAIRDADFQKIISNSEIDEEKKAKKQRNDVALIFKRVSDQEKEIGGGMIVADSLRFINGKLRSTGQDKWVAQLFVDTIAANLEDRLQVLSKSNKNLENIYREAGYCPLPNELKDEEKQHALFWDPKGGPRTWQIVQFGCNIGAAIGLLIAGGVVAASSGCDSQGNMCNSTNDGSQKSAAYLAIASGGGAIGGAIIGAITAALKAGPMYQS